MSNNTSLSIPLLLSAFFIVSSCLCFSHSTATALHGGGEGEQGGGSVPGPAPVPVKHGTVVTKDERRTVVSTEFGEISAVKVSDGKDGFYHLQFITMDPNSLFIPVHLHSDMVFYVDSGSGTLSWIDVGKNSDKLRQVELRTGDVYRLRTGSFFYLQSNLDSDRRKFRITAIFSDSKEEIREGSLFGAYSTLADMLLGFDDYVLQAALNVNEEVMQELRSGGRQAMIVHGASMAEEAFEMHYRSMRAFLGFMENGIIEANDDKKYKAYNILEAKHDFENCNGWSLIVTSKQMKALKDSDFGIFLVNLTKGAMMGPHWNPLTAEIAVVLSGRGMVHVVCPSSLDESECKSSRFRVEEGDVFVVPRYHPMAQISFNNGSFVFMGFTTTQKNNHPQYLVGSASVFQVLDKRVLAASLGVSNLTLDQVLSSQREGVILACTSCAEEEERLMEEDIQRQREEEERKKEEEEERRKEEEARRAEEEARKREEEEAARREQEEARKREEEAAARRAEEEARKREEEEAERREEEEEEERRAEEEAARRADEEARKREEEEAARRAEEEAQKREEEEVARRAEEEARKREEEEARRQQEEARREEEEKATRRRQQEEEAARRQEEEEESAAARRQQEQEEAARQQQQEQEAARQQHEAIRRRQEEEEARRQQQEDEAARQEEAAAARRQQQEDEAARRHEEARRRRQEQEEGESRRREEPWGGRRGGEGDTQGRGRQQSQGEGDAAIEEEEEMAQRMREAEGEGAGSTIQMQTM